MIQFASWRDAKKNHARSKTHLQHATGVQPVNPVGRALDPLVHLGFGNESPRIATPPTSGLGRAVIPVSLVPDHLPMCRCGSTTLRGSDNVGDELRDASRIRSGD